MPIHVYRTQDVTGSTPTQGSLFFSLKITGRMPFSLLSLSCLYMYMYMYVSFRMSMDFLFAGECLYNTKQQLFKRLRRYCEKPWILHHTQLKVIYSSCSCCCSTMQAYVYIYCTCSCIHLRVYCYSAHDKEINLF